MKRVIFLLIFITLLVVQLNWLNQITYAEAPIGNYIQLLGGYIRTTSSDGASLPVFSFDAWIKPDSVSGVQKIVSIGDKDTNSLHYEVGINGGSLSLRFNFGVASLKLITAGNIVADTWNHIAVSITSAYTKLFINGKEVISTSGADNLLPIGKNIVVGRSYLEQGFDGSAYKGDIDELRISTVSRDVASLWSAGVYDSPLFADQGTFLLWHFDEARGEVEAFDSSGNNHHGQLVGADNKIHFFGVLPTPTPVEFVLPTIRWQRPVLPTLAFPSPRIATPTPIGNNGDIFPTPSLIDIRQRLNLRNPVYSR